MAKESKKVEKAVEKAETQLSKLVNSTLVEKYLDKNEIEFDFKKEDYRVRRLTYKEKLSLNEKRIEKQIFLLKAKDAKGEYKYLAEADLKLIYKERNIDIDDMDKRLFGLRTQESHLMKKLGKALKEKKASNQELHNYEEEIEKIREDIRVLTATKTNLLNFSLEQQVLVYVYSYATFLVTEKKVENKWVRLWNTFDKYLNADEGLINLASLYTSLITSDSTANEN